MVEKNAIPWSTTYSMAEEFDISVRFGSDVRISGEDISSSFRTWIVVFSNLIMCIQTSKLHDVECGVLEHNVL
jgi:hypothetical protein